MLIESNVPLTVRLRSGAVQLTPGKPAEFSEEDGLKLLVKAKGKVRLIQHQPVDWAARWTRLAQVTAGLEQDDPRLTPVLAGLASCQRSHGAGNLDEFMEGAKRVRRLMLFHPGSTVCWEGSLDHRLAILGPATVEHVHYDRGKLHVFTMWQGTARWVSETIITTIQGSTI